MFSQFRSLWKWALPAFLALAGVQVQGATFSQTVVVPQDFTDISGTVALPLFDPALGTLTAARIKTLLTVDGSVGVTLSGNAPAPKVIGVSGSTMVNYSSSLSSVNAALGAQSTTISYTTGSAVKNPGETLSVAGPWVQPAYTVNTFSAASDLTAFAGPGTFDMSYATTTPGLTNIGSGGNLSYLQETFAGIEIVIEYDYEPTVGKLIDLTLAKTLTSSGPYAPGSTVTFNLLASNLGPGTAQPAIVVTDTLPAGLSFVSATGTGTEWACSAAGQVVTCTRSANAAPLASGAAAGPITLAAKVAAGATGTLTNVAYVAPAAGEAAAESNPANGYDDGNPATGSNNDASASVTVTAPTPPAPVPTLGEWSLLLLGGLLTTLGMGAQRRRG